MAKKLTVLLATLAVALPILSHIINVTWDKSSLLANIFPIFGLLGFTLLWLHSISGVFEEWLRARFDFDYFVNWSAAVILISIIAHPLIVLYMIKFDVSALLSGGIGIVLGIIGLILLLTYDIFKPLKKRYEFFSRHWNVVLVISTIGFILTFFHSLIVGGDIHGWLRVLWWFYGVTGILATIWTYGLKPLRARQAD